MDPQNSGVDIFGDAQQTFSDVLDRGIRTLGEVGIRDGVQVLNGYAGMYGDPQTLYPYDLVPQGGAPAGVAAVKPADSSMLLVLAAAAYFLLR